MALPFHKWLVQCEKQRQIMQIFKDPSDIPDKFISGMHYLQLEALWKVRDRSEEYRPVAMFGWYTRKNGVMFPINEDTEPNALVYHSNDMLLFHFSPGYRSELYWLPGKQACISLTSKYSIPKVFEVLRHLYDKPTLEEAFKVLQEVNTFKEHGLELFKKITKTHTMREKAELFMKELYREEENEERGIS